jgi:hypothetical protein
MLAVKRRAILLARESIALINHSSRKPYKQQGWLVGFGQSQALAAAGNDRRHG